MGADSDVTLASETEEQDLRPEVERLNKIVRVLMDRAEHMTSDAVSEYGRFQRKLVLGSVVQRQTEELQQALNRNETITRRLKASEARFRGLAEQSLVGIAVVQASRFTFANPRFAETLGYTTDEMLTVPLLDTVFETSRPLFTEHLEKCLTGKPHETLLEYRGCKKNGKVVDLELSSSRMVADGDTALVLVVTDVTARKRAERRVQALNRRLADLAIRDPLTGLYNRRFMEASLERELLQATRSGNPLSVVICDIDHFKSVNDVYGHQAGDEVLKNFASLLKQQSRESDIACRYGGEEFLLVFPGMPATVAMRWAELTRETLASLPVPAGPNTLHITASFGVATFPTHGHTAPLIIAAADTAQYAAKMGGRNRVKCAAVGTVGLEHELLQPNKAPAIRVTGRRSGRSASSVGAQPV